MGGGGREGEGGRRDALTRAYARVRACAYPARRGRVFRVRVRARVAKGSRRRRYGEKGGRQHECAASAWGIRRARFPHERPALIEATGRN